MSPQWNYAKLTHNACLAGGPEAFIHMNRWIGAGEGLLTCLAIMGIHYLFDKYVYAPLTEAHLKADEILSDAEQASLEFNRTVNSSDGNEYEKTVLAGIDIEDAEDWDVLAERLTALESTGEFEEPHATCAGEDELFSFMASIELGEEDKVFIRYAKCHPAYKSFEREYRKHYPEADDVSIVKEFARVMAPYEEK